MSLFDGFRKKQKVNVGAEKEVTIVVSANENKTNTESSEQEKTEGYYFESPLEFTIYANKFANGRQIYWLSGDNYIKEYQRGFQLFEQRQFIKALEAYKNCLKLNPIGISARFEMCETYLQLHNLSSAKHSLLDMKDFLAEEKTIAKFYRRFGFIEIEQGHYREATACYQYSLKFENHQSVLQELLYIKSQGGSGVVTESPEKVLSNACIPVLTAMKQDQEGNNEII